MSEPDSGNHPPAPSDRRGGFDVILGNPPWVRQETLKPIKPLLPMYDSFASTADSSVYFLELATRICRPHGRVAMLTPNKWFRATYAENLRRVLRDRSRLDLLIDFGHSRTLFEDADTFPAAIVLEPVTATVTDSESVRFVRAHDDDREACSLAELISGHAIPVPHGNLRPGQWHLEDSAATELLGRLLATGRALEETLATPILTGLKTGFNEAFYVDSSTRAAIIASDAGAAALFKRFLRGRDVKRWVTLWGDQWHIVIPSSQNHDWPWSEAPSESEAEGIFAALHPSIHAHLSRFKKQLCARGDKGDFWWELRSCDYYDEFDKPKILVQCIAYYSQFALDRDGHYINNKVIVIPTDDLYVLAILNSRIIWWMVNRTFQHMKDEGLSVDVQFLKQLPIPAVSDDLRAEISACAFNLIAASSTLGDRDQISLIEQRLNALVERAFVLTEDERSVLLASLPPRDPLQSSDATPTQQVRPQVEPLAPSTPPPSSNLMQRGRAAAYVNLLARTWAKPVEREAVEYALVFMFNDALRGRLISGQPRHTATTVPAATGAMRHVTGLDDMLGGMAANGIIAILNRSGRQLIQAGPSAPALASYSAEDIQRAQEAVKALTVLKDRGLRLEAVASAAEREFSLV